MNHLEKGYGFKNVFRDFGRDISLDSVSAAVVSAIFAFTSIIFVYSVGPAKGMMIEDINVWMSGCLVFAGLFGLLMSFYYRKPIAVAASFAGVVVFMIVAGQYSVKEAAAGAVVSGIILVVLGITGLMKKVSRFLPAPVVMAMIGGCFLSYGLNVVSPIMTDPIPVVLAILAYLTCMKFLPKFPAVLASIIVGIVYYAIAGMALPVFQPAIIWPTFIIPEFGSNFGTIFISLSIPLTVLVLGAENAQAYGVLLERDYDPPINAMTFVSGIGGILSGFTAGCNINVAGPMTAMCASPDAGKKEGRWTASALLGLIWIIVGPFYGSLASFFGGFPAAFVSMIAGLALFGVLVGAMQGAFRDPAHRMSAMFAFLVAAAGIKPFNISAPFWSLVIGVLIYMIFEKPSKKVDKTPANIK